MHCRLRRFEQCNLRKEPKTLFGPQLFLFFLFECTQASPSKTVLLPPVKSGHSSSPNNKHPEKEIEREHQRMTQPLRIALVCSSNVNRSMAAHKAFVDPAESPFLAHCVCSYGTGKKVKLPGDNNFEFGTAYVQMLEQIIKNSQKEKEFCDIYPFFFPNCQ